MDEFSAFFFLNDGRNLIRLIGSDNFQGQFGQTNSKPQGLLPGPGTLSGFVTCLLFLVNPEREGRKWPGHILTRISHQVAVCHRMFVCSQ